MQEKSRKDFIQGKNMIGRAKREYYTATCMNQTMGT